MTRRSPDDPPFNRAVYTELENPVSERVLFVDTRNRIRAAVYPPEFHTGELQRTRERLEQTGELKAVVHVAARAHGSKQGRGPRTSVVEYIPTGEYFTFQTPSAAGMWITPDPQAVEITQQLFKKRGDS